MYVIYFDTESLIKVKIYFFKFRRLRNYEISFIIGKKNQKF